MSVLKIRHSSFSVQSEAVWQEIPRVLGGMTPLADETGARIARRSRAERDARSWSLAERSGVAKATLSKIERAEISPAAVTLLRVAGDCLGFSSPCDVTFANETAVPCS